MNETPRARRTGSRAAGRIGALLVSFASLLMLAACGGGGDREPAPSGDPAQSTTATRLAGRLCTGAASSGWCWMQPRPYVSAVGDVDFIDLQHGSATDDAGFVLLTDDGGQQWRRPRTPITDGVAVLRRIDTERAWIVAKKPLPGAGRMLRVMGSDDGGRSWRDLAPLNLNSIDKAWSFGPSTFVVTGYRSFARLTWVSDDAGQSWRPSALTAEEMTRAGVLWRQPDFVGLQVSTDFGRSFKTAWAPSSHRVRALAQEVERHPRIVVLHQTYDESKRLYVTSRSLSTDGGASWQTDPVALPAALSRHVIDQVVLDRNGRGLATAYSFDEPQTGDPNQPPRRKQLLRSIDDGLQWESVPIPDVWAQSWNRSQPLPVDTQLVRLNESEWVSLVGGDWRALRPPGTDRAPSEVIVVPSGLLLTRTLTGSSNGVAQLQVSPDRGATWTLVPGSPTDLQGFGIGAEIADLHFFDAQRGVMLRRDGVVRTTEDGGRSWQQQTVPGRAAEGSAQGMHFTPDGVGFALLDGQMRRSLDRGASWLLVPPPPGPQDHYLSMHFADQAHGWALSQRCTVVGGSGSLGFSVICQPMQLHKTADGGATWNSVAAPVDITSSIVSVRLLADGTGLLFMPGRILRSTDGGQSWQPGLAADGQQPWAAVATGQWFFGQPFFVDAAQGWVTARESTGFQLLRTADGGRQWRVTPLQWALQNVNGTHPRIHMLANGHGWIVGAEGVILATRDGGETWVRQDAKMQRQLTAVFALDSVNVWVGGEVELMLGTATGGY